MGLQWTGGRADLVIARSRLCGASFSERSVKSFLSESVLDGAVARGRSIKDVDCQQDDWREIRQLDALAKSAMEILSVMAGSKLAQIGFLCYCVQALPMVARTIALSACVVQSSFHGGPLFAQRKRSGDWRCDLAPAVTLNKGLRCNGLRAPHGAAHVPLHINE